MPKFFQSFWYTPILLLLALPSLFLFIDMLRPAGDYHGYVQFVEMIILLGIGAFVFLLTMLRLLQMWLIKREEEAAHAEE